MLNIQVLPTKQNRKERINLKKVWRIFRLYVQPGIVGRYVDVLKGDGDDAQRDRDRQRRPGENDLMYQSSVTKKS